MRCPKPIIQISKKMKELTAEDTLEVEADDPAFQADVEAWVSQGSSEVLRWDRLGGHEVVLLRKVLND